MQDLDGFRLYLIRRNLKPSTLKGHLTIIRFLQRVVREFTVQAIDDFVLQMKDKGYKNSYINILINTIRQYAKFAYMDEKLQNYKTLPREPSVKATMSDEEIEAFLNIPPPSYTRPSRWKKSMVTLFTNPKRHAIWTVFFSIMAFTGMRPGEVASLTVEDVDWGRDVFVVDETKTNDFRYVPIPPNITQLLKEFLADKTDKLFPTADDVDWNYNFHTRIKRLSIHRKNLTPYSLRHSLITRLLEEDVNLFKVQKIVGHKRLETTAIYAHLTTKDIQEAIKKHPLIRRASNPQDILQALKKVIEGFKLTQDTRFSYEVVETENSLELKVRIK